MFQQIFKQALPHILVVFGFIVLSVIYCHPILEGKRLIQSDVVQWEGSSKEAKEHYKEDGEITLWTNSMFGGMPTYMIYMSYPGSLPSKLGFILRDFVPAPANMLFLCMLGFYLMAMMLGFKVWESVVGSIAFALATYNIVSVEAGHISKVVAIAFAPTLIGAVIMTYRGKYLLGGVLSAFFASLNLYANHIQITYYIVLALVIFAVIEFVKAALSKNLPHFAKASLILAVAGLLAIGTHTTRLWTNYEYAQQTQRKSLSEEYVFQWSYGKMETFTYLIPNFYGGASTGSLDESSETYKALLDLGVQSQQAEGFVQNLPLYWGKLPITSGPGYIGAIVCFLFVFGLLVSKDPIKWWLLGVVVFYTLLAWGNNFEAFNDFMYNSIPLYDIFRAPSMIISLVQIFMVWGALLGIKELFAEKIEVKNITKQLYISVGVVGGLCLVFWIAGSMFSDFKSQKIVSEEKDELGEKVVLTQDDAMQKSLSGSLGNQANARKVILAIQADRARMQSSDALRSLIFILLAGGLIWAFLKYEFSTNYLVLGLGLLVLVDMWAVDKRYLNSEDFYPNSDFEDFFERSDADRQVLQDKDPNFRVLNTLRSPFQDGVTSYHHKSVGGYSTVKLSRYQDLLDEHLVKNNIKVYNMLNTKYFIGGTGKAGETIAQQNPNALGHAWFVEEVKIVKNDKTELKALEKFEPSKTAIVHKAFASQVENINPKPKSASIQLRSYEPDHLVYESNTDSKQIAVFSEIYYVNKGKSEWKAYIDGKEVPHFRANYVLRGLVIPKGKHKIEFKFDTPIYRIGTTIDLIFSIILLLSIAGVIYVKSKKRGSLKE